MNVSLPRSSSGGQLKRNARGFSSAARPRPPKRLIPYRKNSTSHWRISSAHYPVPRSSSAQFLLRPQTQAHDYIRDRIARSWSTASGISYSNPPLWCNRIRIAFGRKCVPVPSSAQVNLCCCAPLPLQYIRVRICRFRRQRSDTETGIWGLRTRLFLLQLPYCKLTIKTWRWNRCVRFAWRGRDAVWV